MSEIIKITSSHSIVTDEQIDENLDAGKWGYSTGQGKLMLVELIVKAGSGSYNSYTEEFFLRSMGVLKSDRTPNKKGLRFLNEMLYASSNNKSEYFKLVEQYKQ